MIGDRRRRKYWIGLGITAICAVPITILLRMILDWGSGGLPPVATIVLLSIIASLLIVATRPWWRALDEMEKDAQLISWYWGGSTGLLVGLMTTVVIGGPGGPMVQGAILAAGVQILFFILFWAGWKIMHRPRSS